jgi:GcrA cell cycle regulator
MMIGIDPTWNEERVELLKKLWSDGLTASQVSRRMACGVSRNAVIGKVHRLGLELRGPSKPRVRKVNPRKIKSQPPIKPSKLAAVFKKSDPSPLPPEGVIPPTAKALMSLEAGDCRYPYGTGPYLFCACKAAPGLPYCEAHARVAYQPPTDPGRHLKKIEHEKAHWVLRELA